MLKTKQVIKQGFTIIELLIVIAIIAILALLVLNNFQGAQAKARDSQRRTDINNIHGKLEEYYNEKGGYPNEALTIASITTLLPGMDEGSIQDADNVVITSSFSTGAAASTTNPGNSGEYRYDAYDCTSATTAPSTPTVPTSCSKYELKAFVEKRIGNETELTGDSGVYLKKSLN